MQMHLQALRTDHMNYNEYACEIKKLNCVQFLIRLRDLCQTFTVSLKL
jgi:hypothetical protein